MTLLHSRDIKKSSYYTRGQYFPPQSKRGCCQLTSMQDEDVEDVEHMDNHYSPATPGDYYRHRIMKMTKFYQAFVC